MKTKITILTFFMFFLLMLLNQHNQVAVSNGAGAPAGNTGSPFDGKTCARVGCHSGASGAPIAGIITSSVPPNGYIPGTTYAITSTCTQAGINKWGFEISPMTASGNLLGSLVIINSNTKIVSSGSHQYVTHTSTGTSGSGTRTWTFNWVAPATGMGPVTFYGAFNFANGNNNSSGDIVHTSTLTVNENTTGIKEENTVFSKFIVYPNPVKDFLVLNFGLFSQQQVEITLTALDGRLIKKTASEEISTGNHQVEIQLQNETTGIYFLTLSSGTEKVVKKVVKI